VREARLREDVERAGVRVRMTVLGRPDLMRVRRHGRDGRDILIRMRCRRGAGDVGDRGDVVPIEAMPETQHRHSREQAEDPEVHWARAYREASQ